MFAVWAPKPDANTVPLRFLISEAGSLHIHAEGAGMELMLEGSALSAHSTRGLEGEWVKSDLQAVSGLKPPPEETRPYVLRKTVPYEWRTLEPVTFAAPAP